jgi:hypothetical protein
MAMARIYRLKGPDGREYGNLTEELIRLWLEQGRVLEHTPVCAEDEGVWRPLHLAFLEGAQAPPPGPAPHVACLNHPTREAVCSCNLCAESFCAECVDAPGAFATCRQCQSAEARDLEPRDSAASGLASEALTWSIFSLFCLGFILGPMAFFKARRALQMAEDNPWPSRGMGKATAAQWIGGVAAIFNALGILRIILAASH